MTPKKKPNIFHYISRELNVLMYELISNFLFCDSLSICLYLSTDQRLDLNKLSPNDSDTVRGQIVGKC